MQTTKKKDKRMSTPLQIVMTQTNYSEVEADEKLKLFDNDYVKVISDYMGISKTQKEKPTTINQEIYKQIRSKLCIKKYNSVQSDSLEKELI
jgi:hypothetical protein